MADFFRLSLQCHPVDHIHGIIKKMGIDLCLEGIKLRNPEIFCRFCLLFHQFIHFSGHIIVGINQITDLIVGFRAFHGSWWSVAYGLHLPDHRRKSSGDGVCQYIGKNKGQNKKTCVEQCNLKHQMIAFVDQRRGRKNCNHKPVCIGNTVKAGINLSVQNVSLNKVVG